MTAFVTTVAGLNFIKARFNSLIWIKDTNARLALQVISKYAPNLIAEQIAYKIKNDALKSANTYFSSMAVHGTSLVMPLKLNAGVDKWRVRGQVRPIVRQVYCNNENYWVAVRRINYNLLLVMYDYDYTLLDQHQFTPKDCQALPTPISR
jgi:hypothetical protein